MKREPAADEIRRGVYGAIGAGLVAGAGLLVALALGHKRPATVAPTSAAATVGTGGCVGCGARSAAKVYG